MALFKHRVTDASIPDGLMDASVELTKGMIVGRKLNADTGKYEIVLPADGVEVYGFVTLREDSAVLRESFYDKIEKGHKAVVYTLVKNHSWRTDQYTGELVVGDKVVAGTDGKLVKHTEGGEAIAEVIEVNGAWVGYENPTITVRIL